MTTNGDETPVTGLRAARKEMAAAKAASKAAHPAGKTPAKKAPATKAPAKAAAKKAPAKTGAAKLKWQFPEGFSELGRTGQTASLNGGELAMKPGEKGGWRATWTKNGKVTMLAEGGAAKCYAACVQFSRKGAAA